LDNDITTTDWEVLTPISPNYLFKPHQDTYLEEYNKAYPITEIFLLSSVGFQTHRDYFVLSQDKESLLQRIKVFTNKEYSDDEIRDMYFAHISSTKYPKGDTRDWKLHESRKALMKENNIGAWITKCIRRPFDFQWYFYHPAAIDYGRPAIMNNLINHHNKAMLWTRPMSPKYEFSVMCANCAVDQSAVGNKTAGAGGTYVAPLFNYNINSRKLYDSIYMTENENCSLNISKEFIREIASKINLEFVMERGCNHATEFGPDDVFNYIYAVLNAPSYKNRYSDLLKIDYPRLPITSNISLFAELCGLGGELVSLHLIEIKGKSNTGFPITGDNVIGKVRYTAPGQGADIGSVWINKTQYFEGVSPEVWGFQIGGYQVCHKWLKDRKGRKLEYDDIAHYENIVSVINETIRIMAEIDTVIEKHGGWPLK